jgi:hypothetical protein
MSKGLCDKDSFLGRVTPALRTLAAMKLSTIQSLSRILGLVALVVSTGAAVHKFYYSRTVIRQNVETNALEVEMRIFTDDLERAIQRSEDEAIRLGDEREIDDANQRIEDYLRNHFTIKVNDRELPMRFWGKEVDYDITWCFFEISGIPDINVIEVKNTTLTDLFDDQLNEVDLDMAGWGRRLQLHREQPSEVVQY